MHIDPESGTRISEESGKTVFGNWVYVSPQESVTVQYVYRLPFQLDVQASGKPLAFSLLTQKQSGTIGSEFSETLHYPKEWNVAWRSPQDEQQEDGEMHNEGMLDRDVFLGAVFQK